MEDVVIVEECPLSTATTSANNRPFYMGEIINDRYEVLKEVAEGGFGLILEVIDRKTNEHLAMKVELEEPKPDEPGLHLEASVLRRLQGYAHILKYYDEDIQENYHYLVMQLAGPTLTDLRQKCPDNHFTTSTTARIALHTLSAIESIHVSGLIHRDVKPANFVFGVDEYSRTVYIIDFGLVRRHLKDGKIRRQRSSSGFRGSVRYASINAHKNVDLGYQDDLWSWMYTIVELSKGSLPWAITLGKKSVCDMKMRTTKETLLADMQPEYGSIYYHLERLSYDDVPQYPLYRNLLMNIVKRKNYSVSSPFDWEPGGAYYQHIQKQMIRFNNPMETDLSPPRDTSAVPGTPPSDDVNVYID